MIGTTPPAANPSTIRRAAVDLPSPGSPNKIIDGLAMMRAGRNQLIGSQQIVSPVSRLRPHGTPTTGVSPPTLNGNNPHTWLVVPRHSAAGSTQFTKPPRGVRRPR